MSRSSAFAFAVFLVFAPVTWGCGDDDVAFERERGDGDGAVEPDPPVPLPLQDASSNPAQSVFHDGGVQRVPDPFVPPDAPEPIAAHGEGDASVHAVPEVTQPPEPELPLDCLQLEPGAELHVRGLLSGERIWRRVEAVESCPASMVSAYEVAYERYTLCAVSAPRSVELEMLGADRLAMPPRDAVADPMLLVYAQAHDLREDPFSCLAINDDGDFAGSVGNSARIARLDIAAGEAPIVIATSRERPDQHGVGVFELTLRAQ